MIITFKYNDKVKKIILSPHFKVFVGRVKDENTIGIDNPIISKKHLQIEHDGANIFITDLGSTNGTFINGRKLKANIKQSISISCCSRFSEILKQYYIVSFFFNKYKVNDNNKIAMTDSAILSRLKVPVISPKMLLLLYLS